MEGRRAVLGLKPVWTVGMESRFPSLGHPGFSITGVDALGGTARISKEPRRSLDIGQMA